MPRKPVIQQTDPATLANARILEQRDQRIRKQQAEQTLAGDIGLNLQHPESAADNAVDFLADEWDRKTFGDSIPTFRRIMYGPDTLLTSCPDMKAKIEQYGLETYANSTMEAILLKEERAVPDPILQKALLGAIKRFGVASVASAFRERILKIPQRIVEVEADREDDQIMAKPFEEAVMRYGTPGMAPKFLSDRCIGVLGLRGYVIVKNEHGEPVKVGTLIMGEIPMRKAEARRRHYAEESDKDVRSMAESFEDYSERAIHDSKISGVSVLRSGDIVHSHAAGDLDDATQTNSYLGRDRETGISFERQA